MKILLSLLMVIVAFTPSTIKEFLRYTGLFYIVSFIFGGATFGFYYFIRGLKSTVNGVSYISKFPVIILLISIIIAYIIVKYCWDFIQYRISRDKIITELCICMDSKKTNLIALVDTGNALSEPITKAHVIVAEYEAIRELLPLEIQEIFEENYENDLNKLTKIMSCSEWVTRFRVIPFKSLGRENGMLIGFKPDEVQITDKDKKIQAKNIIIGVYNKKLSSSNEYCALIHPDVFCGEADIIKAS
jgi:stage II sporulation protein GA (sporulation sigma-E factor processing peptidase)